MSISIKEERAKIIIENIYELSDKEIDIVFKFLISKKYITSKKPKSNICSTEKYLNKLGSEIPKNQKIVKLAELFKKDWDQISKDCILSKHFITQLYSYKNEAKIELIAKRIKQDTSIGTYFENLFGNYLLSFLASKKDMYFRNNNLKINIPVINKPINIPGERNKKQPDVLISCARSGVPLFITELKTSYSHRSLKKEYAEQIGYWRKLNKDVFFLYIIFNASPNKTKTFKQVDNCRIICNDFNYSSEKHIEPKIIDSLEDIFNEIHQNLATLLKKK